MSQTDVAPNKYTFSGENTQITYYTHVPGPLIVGENTNGGRLEYQGVEGNHTASGQELEIQISPFGQLLTLLLKPNNDTGGLIITVLLPNVLGVTSDNPVTFETLAIKTTIRAFTVASGAEHAYAVISLLATANIVPMPLVLVQQ